MKKYLIYLLAVLCAGFLASCTEDDPIASDTVRVLDVVTTPADKVFGQDTKSISMSMTFTSTDQKLESLVISRSIKGNSSELKTFELSKSESNLEGLNDDSYQFDWVSANEIKFTFTDDLDGLTLSDDDEVVYTFKVSDKDAGFKEASITFTYNDTSDDLAAATSFSFSRDGGSDATGLDMFGLAWTSNTSSVAVVTKSGSNTRVSDEVLNASKLVNLSSTDWNATTKTALKAAIDGATGVDKYEGISVTANKSDYTDVIGTIVGNKYYMIKIVSSTVGAGTNGGSLVTVQAEYKLAESVSAQLETKTKAL